MTLRRELLLPVLISLLFVVLILARMLTPPARIAPAPIRAPHAEIAPNLAANPIAIMSDVSVILSRPLFSQSRHPASDKTVQAVGVADPRLSAIFVTPASRRAVFDDGTAKPLVASVDGHAGPFHVVAIDPDSVTVIDGAGRRRHLRPTLKSSSAKTQDAGTENGAGNPDAGLSLLQQLQRNGVPHDAVPPPPSIQSLMERLQHPTRE